MTFLYLKTILKLLFSRRKQFFLTVFGIVLPLFLYIIICEAVYSYTESAYRHLQNFDRSGVLIQTEAAPDLSGTVSLMKEKHLPYTLLQSTDQHFQKMVYIKKRPVQVILDAFLLSGNISEGYLPYEAMDICFENKIHLRYTYPFSGKEGSSDISDINDQMIIPCMIEQSTSLLLFGENDSAGEIINLTSPLEQKDILLQIFGIIDDLPSTPQLNLRLNRSLSFSGEEGSAVTSRPVYIPAKYKALLQADNSSGEPSFCCFHLQEDRFQEEYRILQRADLNAGFCILSDYGTILSQIHDQVLSIQVICIPLFILLMIISGLLIMNTMFFSIQERTKEIGIRRSVGAGIRPVIAQFLLEGLMIGIFSASAACIFSSFLLNAVTFVMLYVIGNDLAVSLHIQTVLFIFLFTVSLTMIFSLPPAFKAASQDPSAAFLS